jgi:hypothetical protein
LASVGLLIFPTWLSGALVALGAELYFSASTHQAEHV